ncbi:MAG TPA: hypothetical protein VD931_01945 [Baekduia sp.]|nr:hypothetical protein [Baekduia sp.]
MPDRWFDEETLEQLSRPTMDRAIEALDRGDVATARALCEAQRHEWQMLHDLYAEGTAALLTFIKERLGEDAIAAAHEETMQKSWRRHVEAVAQLDRRRVVELLAATWRAHSTSGVGPNPGAFTITEDDEKVTFSMNPCGSGQRLWRNGHYAREDGYALVDGAHDWTHGRRGLPIYCSHCSFMNELLPLRWVGFPIYPSHMPEDFDHDPCVWHWYKDPAAIPAEHWERYGLEKPA